MPTGTLNKKPSAGQARKAGTHTDSAKLCAYNQTRECFLGLEVESADLTLTKLKDRIASLTLKSGEGLWLSPFRGLPEWGIRVPLDLLYLDEDHRVVELVESYPVFRASSTTPHPASILALPTHSIYSSQTQPGDQMVLCVAEEMQQRLEKFAGPATPAPLPQNQPAAPLPAMNASARTPRSATTAPSIDTPRAPQASVATASVQAANGVVQSAVLLREKPLWSGGPGLLELENRSEEPQPKPRHSHVMGLIQPEMEDVRPPRGWLERWWSPDPRKAPREDVPGLAAYYWTGGPPQPHEVRDISSTGLYVVTEERWYPGTLVLMTLQITDEGEELTERSICVHSRAVRWGKDGVGLEFVVQKDPGADPAMAAADKKALDRFLKKLQKNKR